MSIVRKHRPAADNYTVISNAWVRDENLSYQAIGLLTQLMSHREGWQVSIRSLAGKHRAGRDAIRSIVAELEAAGYLVRAQPRDAATQRFSEALWETREPESQPVVEPSTGEPRTGEPTTASPTTKKNNLKEEQLEKDQGKNSSAISQPDLFDDFWAAYPRKEDKKPAQRVFERLPYEDQVAAVAGAKRYAADPNLPTSKFQKLAKTWLNAESWNNPPLPERPKSADEKLADRERENAERRARYALEEGLTNE